MIYPPETVPEKYLIWFYHLNPMYYLIQILRKPIYEGVLPGWSLLAAGAAIAMLTLAFDWVVLCSRADEFAHGA
jgi:ABC-type polysaccharide/polyol phosphate export permease